MKLFVGLGNPGREYALTKHNVGFMLADALARALGAADWRVEEKFRAELTACYVGGEKVLLAKPQTYMNLSGEAVRPLTDYYRIGSDELIVAHDDMDLPVGMVRLRPKGSSGGHRGMESIIGALGTEAFARVRIGIGRPPSGWSVNGHVLSALNEEDSEAVKAAIEYLVPAVECILTDGIESAMNKFNPKKAKKNKAPDPL